VAVELDTIVRAWAHNVAEADQEIEQNRGWVRFGVGTNTPDNVACKAVQRFVGKTRPPVLSRRFGVGAQRRCGV
jgi:hypothetical protein